MRSVRIGASPPVAGAVVAVFGADTPVGNGVAVVVDLFEVDGEPCEQIDGGVAGQEVDVETGEVRQREFGDAVSDERQASLLHDRPARYITARLSAPQPR